MAELRLFYQEGQKIKISKSLDILKQIEKKDIIWIDLIDVALEVESELEQFLKIYIQEDDEIEEIELSSRYIQTNDSIVANSNFLLDNYQMEPVSFIIKNGIFYNVLGNDCYLLKNIFNYKINSFSDTVKVGFPLNTLNNVINTFDKLKINYIVYENEIVLKGKFPKNKYDIFLKSKLSMDDRIKRINLKLNEMKQDSKILGLLDAIEEII